MPESISVTNVEKQKKNHTLDSITIALFNRGDINVFSAVYRKLYPAIVYFSKTILGDEDEAKDVASETFIKIWEKKGLFPNYETIQAFAYKVARNACYDRLRSQVIHNRIHGEIMYISDHVQEINRDNYDSKYDEYIQALSLEMQELPDRCQEIFELLFFDNKTTTEIAHQLDLSTQTVRNHKTKAVNLLSAALQKKDASPATINKRKKGRPSALSTS